MTQVVEYLSTWWVQMTVCPFLLLTVAALVRIQHQPPPPHSRR